jgi:hypothetical protein
MQWPTSVHTDKEKLEYLLKELKHLEAALARLDYLTSASVHGLEGRLEKAERSIVTLTKDDRSK